MSQYYVTEAENEYVIRGNAAIVHCKIPSFVTDFVYVESWIMDDGQILTIDNTNNGQGTFSLYILKKLFLFPLSPSFNAPFDSCFLNRMESMTGRGGRVP